MNHSLFIALLILPSLVFAATDHPSKWGDCVLWLDGNGSALDQSFRGNHGVLTNNTTFGAGPLFGAFAFDGTGDGVWTVNNDSINFGSGNFTVTAWVNATDTTASVIVDRREGGPPNVGWDIDNAGAGAAFRFVVDNDPTTLIATSTTVCQAGVWQHVAAVRDADNIHIYVNGVLEGTTTGASGMSFDVSARLVIGNRDLVVAALDLNGRVASVGVFRRAMNASEINRIRGFR